jgi:hypothetical protein
MAVVALVSIIVQLWVLVVKAAAQEVVIQTEGILPEMGQELMVQPTPEAVEQAHSQTPMSITAVLVVLVS